MLKLLSIFLFLTLSACEFDHGGSHDPIATADVPFQSSDSNQLAKLSKSFAKSNGLDFRKESKGNELRYWLENDDIAILANVSDHRLKVTATGPVTSSSIELANRFINEATAVRP